MKTSRKITHNGKTQSLYAWSKELNMPYQRLYTRLFKMNMSIEDAFRKDVLTKKYVEWKGEKYTFKELEEKTGIKASTIADRVQRKGMSVDDAVSCYAHGFATEKPIKFANGCIWVDWKSCFDCPLDECRSM